jgi:2-polyprenyl-6-methoxyphenol hydroxylase-like FAD-dependent oxidoreductase
VLINYFERVTIIERDHLPDSAESRKGVPQARHLHNMVMQGWNILETFFPGMGEELIAAGAPRIEWPADLLWLGRTGWSPRFYAGVSTYSCSRNLMEWRIRRRITASEKVHLIEGHTVTGLVPDADRRSIIGVQVQPYAPSDKESEGNGSATSGGATEMYADLVVDASGRGSQTPRWLESMGYATPTQTVIKPYVGYGTRYYTRPDGSMPDWKVLLVQSRPPANNRAAGLFLLENNEWILTLVGVGGDYPPTDEEGYLEFIRSLPDPELYNFIKECWPSSPIYSYRIPQNRLIHFEKMPTWPERFIVLGDAVCGFNPTYGHGISVSAQAALALNDCLREQRQRKPDGDLTGLARNFQHKLYPVVSAPWLFTSGEDMRYPTTEGGKRDWMTRLVHWYVDGVMLYAIKSPNGHRTLIEVMHLLKPPAALLRPSILVNALAINIERFASEIASYGKAEN